MITARKCITPHVPAHRLSPASVSSRLDCQVEGSCLNAGRFCVMQSVGLLEQEATGRTEFTIHGFSVCPAFSCSGCAGRDLSWR